MIYIEQDDYSSSLYKVEKVGGHYLGWNKENRNVFEGYDFTLYSNEDGYVQAFLAPSILDRW